MAMEMAKERTKRLPKFRELPRAQQIFRVGNAAVCLALMILLAVKLGTSLAAGDPENRVFSCITLIGALILPYAVELLFRMRFSCFVLSFYFAEILVAGIVGAAYNLYNTVSWYDLFAHGVFGYVGCMSGLFLLGLTKDLRNVRPVTVVLFCFAVSMAMGAVWEMMEFGADVFFQQYAQGVPDASGFVPVNDTMEDILMNFAGAIAFVFHYILHRATRKNLLMGSMIADFAGHQENA